MQIRNRFHTNLLFSISLFCLLITIYNLTYSGTYITDDEHILASRTLSTAYDEQINDDRVLGNSRVFSYSILPPIEASQGLNIEPIQAFLGSFLAKLAVYFDLGHVQTIYILNIYLTALTALLLFWILIILGYAQRTSFIIGILFGLCTIAWPYTKTYFRDSVAMFFLTISWGTYLILISKRVFNFQSMKRHYAFVAILLGSLVIGIMSKNSILFAIPVFIFSFLSEVIFYMKEKNIILIIKSGVFKILAALSLSILFIYLWIIISPDGYYSRFSLSYYGSVLRNLVNNPHPQLTQALAGPIISPGKSIFLYSPILVFALISLFKYFRIAWPAWLFFGLLVAGQGLFYGGDWFGHVNWGLRFVIPAIPPLMIICAPVIEHLLDQKKGLAILLMTGLFSMFVQFIAVLAPVKNYYISLANSIPSVLTSTQIWNPKFSALWWHINWILSGGKSDILFIQLELVTLPLFTMLLLGLCSSIFFSFGKYSLQYGVTILLFSILSSVFLLFLFHPSHQFQIRNDLENSKKTIQEKYLPTDVILIKSYGTTAWSYWMNWANPELKWLSLPFYFPAEKSIESYYDSRSPFDTPNDISLRIMQKAESEHKRIWLVIPDDSPGSNMNWEVTYLTQDEKILDYWSFFSEGHSIRLYLFNTP